MQEHYWSTHPSKSSKNGNLSLGDHTSPTPARSLRPFDGPSGWKGATRDGFTTLFGMQGHESSTVWNTNAALDTPAVDNLNRNAYFTHPDLTNQNFAPYPVTEPSIVNSGYLTNVNNTYQSMGEENPILTDVSTFKPEHADHPNLTESYHNVDLTSLDITMLHETQPNNHNPDGPSSTSSPSTTNRPPILCPHCRKPFARQSDMQRHARKHDPAATKLSCRVAGCIHVGQSGFLRADKLRSHMRNAHGI